MIFYVLAQPNVSPPLKPLELGGAAVATVLKKVLARMSADKTIALELLGKQLINEVFDRACEYLQGVILHGMKGGKPDSRHEAYQGLDESTAELVRCLMFEAVDQTFAQFLYFLDEHRIPLPVKREDGEIVDVAGVSDGLAAEPYSEIGWIAKFSEFKNGIDLKL